MSNANDTASDVLVVGGGPVGSTVAALLARKGLSVTLIERDRHPRFHIGESLLPMNMPIVERLGLSEHLKAIGLKKLGADFPADNERGYNVFSFDRCLNPTWPFAYQVKRDEFDLMLFEHAGRSGATTLQGAKAGRVEPDESGATVEITVDGETRRHRARYLIDASGRDTVMGSQLRLKRRNPEHHSAADPIFSTGVYLAMHSAELAEEVVEQALREPKRERALQRQYERNARKGIDSLSWFIFRFNSPGIAWLFRNPRNMLRVEEAMISMLAGDVFRDGGVKWRLQLFKLLYYITSTIHWRESLASWMRRRRQVSMQFAGGTTRQDAV